MRSNIKWLVFLVLGVAALGWYVTSGHRAEAPAESTLTLLWHENNLDYRFNLRRSAPGPYQFWAELSWSGGREEVIGTMTDLEGAGLIARASTLFPQPTYDRGQSYAEITVFKDGQIVASRGDLSLAQNRKAFEQLVQTGVGNKRRELMDRLPPEGPAGRVD